LTVSPASAEGRLKNPAATLALLGGLIVGWFLLIQYFEEGDVYGVMGPFGCVVCIACWAINPRALGTWLRPTARAIAIGLGTGIAMTALTYPVFQVASALVPVLDTQVEVLYHGARSTTLARALGWTIPVILAEELLYRGAFPAALRPWLSELNCYGVSLFFYALAQGGTGSWIVMAMAVVCGAIWSLLRVYTGSLVAPLIAHLIWTPTVIFLYPVT
jgi:membrane protease YdiL (CAAX protease family)